MGRRPCCAKIGMNKGAWTSAEDKILADFILLNGEGKWTNLPRRAGLKRCGKSCRLRWLNYLRPDIKRGNISDDEEDLIIRLHKLLGNRWSLIAGRLPGRTDNEIKNYWNTTLRKKAHDNHTSVSDTPKQDKKKRKYKKNGNKAEPTQQNNVHSDLATESMIKSSKVTESDDNIANNPALGMEKNSSDICLPEVLSSGVVGSSNKLPSSLNSCDRTLMEMLEQRRFGVEGILILWNQI